MKSLPIPETQEVTMEGTKITGLSPLNVAALREVYPEAIAEGDIVLTATTATWTRATASVAAIIVGGTISRLPGRGHPRMSLYAVRRRLVDLAVSEQETAEADAEPETSAPCRDCGAPLSPGSERCADSGAACAEPTMQLAPTAANLEQVAGERRRVFSANRTRPVFASTLKPGAIVLVEAVEGFLFGIVIRATPAEHSPGTTVIFGYGDGGARTTRYFGTGVTVQQVGAR